MGPDYYQPYPHPGAVPDPPELPVGVSRVDDRTWPFWMAPMAIGAGFFAVLAALSVLALIAAMAGVGIKSAGFIDLSVLFQDAALVAVCFYLSTRIGPFSWRRFGLRRAGFGRTLGVTVLVALAYFVCLAIYTSLIDLKADDVPIELGADQGGAALYGFVLLVVIAAPFAEEIFFRGTIFSAFATKLGMFPAAVVSGLLFGLVHWDFATVDGLLQAAPLAVFGIMLAMLYSITKTLYACIGLHATNNTLAAIGFALDQDSSTGVVIAVVAWVAVMGVVIRAPSITDPTPDMLAR